MRGVPAACVFLVTAALLAAAMPAQAQDIPLRVPRGGILIESDADFLPQNGVIGGLGTEELPYVIGGWSLDPSMGIPDTFGSALRISGTSSHYVIRDVEILVGFQEGVWLLEAPNGRVTGVDITLDQSITYGIRSANSGDLIIEDLQVTFEGLGIGRSGILWIADGEDRITLREVLLQNITADGVLAAGGGGTVEDVRISGQGASFGSGIRLRGPDGATASAEGFPYAVQRLQVEGVQGYGLSVSHGASIDLRGIHMVGGRQTATVMDAPTVHLQDVFVNGTGDGGGGLSVLGPDPQQYGGKAPYRTVATLQNITILGASDQAGGGGIGLGGAIDAKLEDIQIVSATTAIHGRFIDGTLELRDLDLTAAGGGSPLLAGVMLEYVRHAQITGGAVTGHPFGLWAVGSGLSVSDLSLDQNQDGIRVASASGPVNLGDVRVQDPRATGIRISASTVPVAIDRSSVDGAGSAGLWIHDVHDLRLRDSDFTNNKDGAVLQDWNGSLADNAFAANDGAGVRLCAGDPHGPVIKEANDFEGNTEGSVVHQSMPSCAGGTPEAAPPGQAAPTETVVSNTSAEPDLAPTSPRQDQESPWSPLWFLLVVLAAGVARARPSRPSG